MATLSKLNGTAIASISKIDGTAIASLSKFDGLDIVTDFHTGALSFGGSGSGEYMYNSTNNPLGVTDQHSMAIFFRPQAIASNGMIFVARNSGSAANIIQIELLSGDGTLRFVIHNSAGTQIKDYRSGASGKVANGTKYCIGYTRNAGTLTIYRDATDITSGATKTTDTAGNMTATDRRVAMASEFGAGYCQCDIANVIMWNTNLSSASWAAVVAAGPNFDFANNTSGNYTETANCMHEWALGKDSGNIGADYGNAGTLIDVDTNAVNMSSADIITY